MEAVPAVTGHTHTNTHTPRTVKNLQQIHTMPPAIKQAGFLQPKCLRRIPLPSTLAHLAWANETSWLCGQQKAADQYLYRRLRPWYRRQALQVMNCLRDICPQHGGIAAAQLGTATAAIRWWALPFPSRSETSRRLTLGSHCPSMCQRVQSQAVIPSGTPADLIQPPCIPPISVLLLGFLKLVSQFGFVYLNCLITFLKSNTRTLLVRSLKLDSQELEFVFKCGWGVNKYTVSGHGAKQNETNIPPWPLRMFVLWKTESGPTSGSRNPSSCSTKSLLIKAKCTTAKKIPPF